MIARGILPASPADTRIAGTVLDNQDAPIPGVTVRVAGDMATTATDESGSFVLSGSPVGTVHLTLFASSSSRLGPWPTMALEVHTVSGCAVPSAVRISVPATKQVSGQTPPGQPLSTGGGGA